MKHYCLCGFAVYLISIVLVPNNLIIRKSHVKSYSLTPTITSKQLLPSGVCPPLVTARLNTDNINNEYNIDETISFCHAKPENEEVSVASRPPKTLPSAEAAIIGFTAAAGLAEENISEDDDDEDNVMSSEGRARKRRQLMASSTKNHDDGTYNLLKERIERYSPEKDELLTM